MVSNRLKRSIIGTPLQPFAEWLRHGPIAELGAAREPQLAQMHRDDRAVRRAMRRLIGRDTDCLDVGAHLGSMLATMMRLAPDGRHVAVEATPAKAASLAARFPKATILPFAVSDEDGTATLHTYEGAEGYNSLAPARGGDPKGREGRMLEVPVRRLDDVLPDGFGPGFVKIDVEGFELPALRGAEATLRRCRPDILFECGPVGDGAFGDDLFAYLTGALGYDVFAPSAIVGGEPPLTIDAFRERRTYPFAGFNYVARPRS